MNINLVFIFENLMMKWIYAPCFKEQTSNFHAINKTNLIHYLTNFIIYIGLSCKILLSHSSL
jgi:hypothetical protein